MRNFWLNLAILGFSSFFISSCSANIEGPLEYSDERITIETSTGREIPVRLLTPEGCSKCALVIFSHGANSTYDRYNKLLLPIAEAGYRVAIPNHTDSEEHPHRGDYKPQDWSPTRLEDYATIATQYETDHLFAVGHSFGALIAQIAGGATLPNMPKVDIPRPLAVIAYSPPGAVPNFFPAKTWSSVNVPTLVSTGTTDIVPMMAEKWELHLNSYEETASELAYALIYDSMDHYMNGAYGRETDIETTERDQSINHLVQSSLFFMDYIKTGNRPTQDQWNELEQSFVEARANHEQ